jgi:hypothetical protein
VVKPAFVRPIWSKPAPLGYGNSIDSVAGVASPLLAGFSLASVIVVSEDAKNFRWAGAAILALVIAAVVLIGAVQCGYNARQYLWSGAEAQEWWPQMRGGSELETLLAGEQSEAFRRWQAWSSWTRLTYDCGILALLAGLALVLPPQHETGIQNALRWAASGVALFACAGEVAWIIKGSWARSREARRNGKL